MCLSTVNNLLHPCCIQWNIIYLLNTLIPLKDLILNVLLIRIYSGRAPLKSLLYPDHKIEVKLYHFLLTLLQE